MSEIIPWTPEEIKKLRGLYGEGKKDQEISGIMGRSVSGIQQKRSILGLVHTKPGRVGGRHGEAHVAYSEQEIAQIKKLLEDGIGNKDIGKQVGRSAVAISSLLSSHGWTRKSLGIKVHKDAVVDRMHTIRTAPLSESKTITLDMPKDDMSLVIPILAEMQKRNVSVFLRA
jgi:hypothetical protein